MGGLPGSYPGSTKRKGRESFCSLNNLIGEKIVPTSANLQEGPIGGGEKEDGKKIRAKNLLGDYCGLGVAGAEGRHRGGGHFGVKTEKTGH